MEGGGRAAEAVLGAGGAQLVGAAGAAVPPRGGEPADPVGAGRAAARPRPDANRVWTRRGQVLTAAAGPAKDHREPRAATAAGGAGTAPGPVAAYGPEGATGAERGPPYGVEDRPRAGAGGATPDLGPGDGGERGGGPVPRCTGAGADTAARRPRAAGLPAAAGRCRRNPHRKGADGLSAGRGRPPNPDPGGAGAGRHPGAGLLRRPL
mmetsp:Transcript_138342/g.240560  ORF Transcript_138342/g.240560 Transcript_138342/m.240560 type:complete len:208 (+) Transcript_138342:987-1610(+)